MNEVDAWDAFGTDDESDDAICNESSHISDPKALLGQQSQVSNGGPETKWAWESILCDDNDFVKSVAMKPNKNWKEEIDPAFVPHFSIPPLYQSPFMKYLDNMPNRGGGRGYICTQDITPGTLLFAEAPFVPIAPREDCKGLRQEDMFIKELLEVPAEELQYALNDLAKIFPQSLDELSAEHLDLLRGMYSDNIRDLLKRVPEGVLSIIGPLLSEDSMLRLICALRMNAFEGGFYLYFSLVNHSCRPNCIKWKAGTDGRHYSELRATELIKAGSEITINYIEPRERSFDSRSETLWQQFQFRCSCILCNPASHPYFKLLEELRSEDVESGSLIDRDLSNTLKETEALLHNVKQGNVVVARALSKILNEHERAFSVLGPRHITLARSNRLIIQSLFLLLGRRHISAADEAGIECTSAVVRASSVLDDKLKSSMGSDTNGRGLNMESNKKRGANINFRWRLLYILIESLLAFRATQIILIGAGPHPDSAETLGEISQALRLILAEGSVAMSLILLNWGEINEVDSGKTLFLFEKDFFSSRRSAEKFEELCDRTGKSISKLFSDELPLT